MNSITYSACQCQIVSAQNVVNPAAAPIVHAAPLNHFNDGQDPASGGAILHSYVVGWAQFTSWKGHLGNKRLRHLPWPCRWTKICQRGLGMIDANVGICRKVEASDWSAHHACPRKAFAEEVQVDPHTCNTRFMGRQHKKQIKDPVSSNSMKYKSMRGTASVRSDAPIPPADSPARMMSVASSR